MQIDILPYAKERIPDVINFEENLRDKKISGDGKSTKPTGKMLKRTFAPLNFLIQSRCLPMSKARWSAESTPV